MTLDPAQHDYAGFYDGRRVCITGGAGFIGSALTLALVDLGADVSVIDDLCNGLESNLAPVRQRLRFRRASILDESALAAAADGASIVFHQAALGSVPRSVAEPALYHEVNTTGTFLVLEAARRAGAERVVYASSSSVYGEQAASPKIETMTPDPRSPYAASKIAGEHLALAWARCYGLSSIGLRYFNIFGPRQRPDSPYAAVIPRFATALLNGAALTVFGDGTQTRDFTHVDNAVHANLLAGAARRELTGEAVNIACGEQRSLLQLIEVLRELLDAEPRIEFAPPRPGDVMHSKASIEKAKALIGYEPIVDFRAGLADAVAHYSGLQLGA